MSAGELILTACLKDMTWSLVERQSQQSERGGFDPVYVLGRPFWRVNFRYENLNDAEFRPLSAWLSRRRGARFSFTAPRMSRPRPALWPGLASNAGLGVSAVDIAASTVTITGVGANVISAGDMVGYYTANNGYWVGEATANAVPSSGSVVIPVHPYPQTPHASTPNVRLLEALGEFKLTGPPQVHEPYDRFYSVGFSAVQVVR